MKKISIKKNNAETYVIIIVSIIICISIILIFNYINKNNIEGIFSKYELNINDTIALYEIEKEIKTYIIISVLSVLVLTVIVIAINYILANSSKKRIDNTLLNIENIINNNYKLEFGQMPDDNFGMFQNQIYQIVDKLQEYSNSIREDREELSKYLEDISHQIRTPLMAMTVMTDNMVADGSYLDKDTREYAQSISKQLSQINWMVDNLLKMASLDTKSVVLRKEEIEVGKLFKEVIKNIEILLELNEQEVVIEGKKELTFIGDFKRNVEAFTNIIKNSAEHSKKGEKIYIKFSENALYMEIVIEDRGSGISEKDLPHIFDRFYKGENSSSNSFGIGLSLAKEIIKYQKGEIAVKSEISKGTKFVIKFFK